jgi:hypothetical protein
MFRTIKARILTAAVAAAIAAGGWAAGFASAATANVTVKWHCATAAKISAHFYAARDCRLTGSTTRPNIIQIVHPAGMRG